LGIYDAMLNGLYTDAYMIFRHFLIIILLTFLRIPFCLNGQNLPILVEKSTIDSVRQNSDPIGNATQDKEILSPIDEYVLKNQSLPKEKIFLHLDRTTYIQGDTIWFKGYTWYGYEQVPDTTSSILYVDILDSKGKIKLSKKVLLQNGTSEGDFSLDTTIISGKYFIRAYTRWMQNGNAGDPFYQSITVNPGSQNFQLECNPVIVKHSEGDSLNTRISFFEVDPAGNLKNTYTHKIRYFLKAGEQLLDSGQILAVNTIQKSLGSTLSHIDTKETKAVLELSIDDSRLTYKKQFEIQLKDAIDIQFFPEGGTMVMGLQNKIAFKAIGTDGLSRDVKGVIERNDGSVICDFESSHKGMGAFILKPEPGKEYFARLMYHNQNYVIPLPAASEKGCIIMVSSAGNTISSRYLTIRCNPSEIKTKRYVTGSANGKIWFSMMVEPVKDSCKIKIPIELLPEGTCRITILSADFKPECERIIYVDWNERFKIEIEPDSLSYATRSKVTLLIKATGVDGAPVQANLSLSVIDKEQTTIDPTVTGINTYKLLQSELKGNIEDAGYYFSEGKCADPESLDLLLLTQGYRKFLPINTNNDEQKYQPERGFSVSGTIVVNGSKSRAAKFDYRSVGITYLCQTGNLLVNQLHPDSLGRFRFQIPLVYGKPPSILQAKTSKDRKLNGGIYLDETVDPPKFAVPLISDINRVTPVVENIRRMQTVIKTELSKDPTTGYMMRNLPAVVVTAKAKNWYLNFEKDALKIADLDSLDPNGNKYESLYDLLKREFGAREIPLRTQAGLLKTIFMPSINIGRGNDYFPIYVVDGGTWFNGIVHSPDELRAKLSMISLMNVNEIKKLIVLPPNSDLVYYYADKELYMDIKQTLVVIETYKKGYRGDPQGIKTFILEGLDAPRQFYSPRYDPTSGKSPEFDGRTTVFWKPTILTDENGQAKVDFFTTDRNSTFDIIVNGITGDSGAPGYGKMQINSSDNKSEIKNSIK
jgi:hypothetical protein